jgi:dihydroorotate dehydrogenase
MALMLERLVLPALRRLDAERAHRLALTAIGWGLTGRAAADDPRLATRLAGLSLANPIGLAAGFDKDATALSGLARVGFGFLEAGTVTPLAQAGNPRPRLFRLPEDAAVINRMGFNNAGIEPFSRHFRAVRAALPVGVNIGLNKQGSDPERDYPALVRAVADRAAYVAINVSSPNTPGLRDLQTPGRLTRILGAIHRAVPAAPKLFVKLAPDLADDALADIVAACIDGGATGLIVSNTTTARPATLRDRNAAESGGLSGVPLMARSTAMLRIVARLAGGRLALIGVGGISRGADVLEKLLAGASAVQLYTALALRGPGLLPRLKRELLLELDRAGLPDVSAAIGRDV